MVRRNIDAAPRYHEFVISPVDERFAQRTGKVPLPANAGTHPRTLHGVVLRVFV
jgi:hypothetical protein